MNLPAGEARVVFCSVTLLPLQSVDDHYSLALS